METEFTKIVTKTVASNKNVVTCDRNTRYILFAIYILNANYNGSLELLFIHAPAISETDFVGDSVQ